MQKRIKFTTAGSSAETGYFSEGDTAIVSEEMARHLVDDMQSATYDGSAPEGSEGSRIERTTKEQRVELRKQQAAPAGTRTARTESAPKSVSEAPAKKTVAEK